MTRAAVDDFHAHSRIDAAMAELFTDVSVHSGPYQEAARTAALCFRERSDYWSKRAAIFDEPSIRSRGSAYLQFHRHHAQGRHWWGAHLKDIVLGVSGASRSSRTSSAFAEGQDPCP